MALSSMVIESKAVHATAEALNALVGVNMVWIKSHSGIPDNEAVDQMAKDSTMLAEIESQLASKSYIRNQVLDRVRERWDNEWSQYPKARQSKQFFLHQDKARAKEIMSLSRYKLGRLIRITSGHNQLGYHQFVINPSLSRLCRYCNDADETFAHWSDNCPAFEADGQDVFGGPSGVFSEEWMVDRLLYFPEVPRIKRALSHYVPNDDPEAMDIDSGSNAPNTDNEDDVDNENILLHNAEVHTDTDTHSNVDNPDNVMYELSELESDMD